MTMPEPAGPPATDAAQRPPSLVRFLAPSVVGVGMFLVPIPWGDTVNIGFGILAEVASGPLEAHLPAIAAGILTLSVLLSAWASWLRPGWATRPGWEEVFRVGAGWLGLRALGAAFALMTLFQWGPGFLIHGDTGGVMLNDLLPILVTFFFFALLLLPFLVEFGFMEFVGTLLRRPFRWLFRLPGRSAIDASASWMGSGTVGVLITYQQYEGGYYSRREAAVIATTFSVVSIPFCLVIASFLGLGHRFVPFYATVVVAGLVAAIVVPRLPPLSRKPDTYHEGVGPRIVEEAPREKGLLAHAVEMGAVRAASAPAPRTLVRGTAVNLADIFFGLLPLVMVLGTLAMATAEFTPVFQWLAWPLVPVLELLRLPEAGAAAPAMLVGFADMFLPAVLLSGVESDLTRFVIGTLSLVQLVYLSEVGAIILRSSIPLNLWELAVIFLLRTGVALPVVAGVGHLIV